MSKSQKDFDFVYVYTYTYVYCFQERQMFEQNLLSTADFEKIKNFKRVFQPQNLPDELLTNQMYIQGSNTTHQDILAENFNKRR